MTKAVVVDYGIGNVFSVCNAISALGIDPCLTRDSAIIRDADRVILPGVGAFARAMSALKKYGLDDVLKDYVASERPFLGICIGMQVLMEGSTEFGNHVGLGFIKGQTRKLSAHVNYSGKFTVPHIGWTTVKSGRLRSVDDWNSSPFVRSSEHDGAYYFVHSFAVQPTNEEDILAEFDYGGNRVVAAIQNENILGVQFHPERSGPVGLGFLKSFLSK